MASELPGFPRFVFTIFEPITLIAGCIAPLVDPESFLQEQIAGSKPFDYNENARLIALQLGNCYGLLCLVGLAVLWTTSEYKVVRSYLWALWVADLSHVGLTAYSLGYDRFLAVSGWNATTWGNIGITTFLCLTRTAYLLGLFGAGGRVDRRVAGAKKTA